MRLCCSLFDQLKILSHSQLLYLWYGILGNRAILPLSRFCVFIPVWFHIITRAQKVWNIKYVSNKQPLNQHSGIFPAADTYLLFHLAYQCTVTDPLSLTNLTCTWPAVGFPPGHPCVSPPLPGPGQSPLWALACPSCHTRWTQALQPAPASPRGGSQESASEPLVPTLQRERLRGEKSVQTRVVCHFHQWHDSI